MMEVQAGEATRARQIAVDHALALREFDEWLTAFGVGADRRIVEAHAERGGSDAVMARACLGWFDETGADELSWLAWQVSALDTEIEGRYDIRENCWEVTGVALLVSYGGPTVRYRAHDDGETIVVEVAWWGDSGSYAVECSLCGFLDLYTYASDSVSGLA